MLVIYMTFIGCRTLMALRSTVPYVGRHFTGIFTRPLHWCSRVQAFNGIPQPLQPQLVAKTDVEIIASSYCILCKTTFPTNIYKADALTLKSRWMFIRFTTFMSLRSSNSSFLNRMRESSPTCALHYLNQPFEYSQVCWKSVKAFAA